MRIPKINQYLNPEELALNKTQTSGFAKLLLTKFEIRISKSETNSNLEKIITSHQG